jgi:hypothetical protein
VERYKKEIKENRSYKILKSNHDLMHAICKTSAEKESCDLHTKHLSCMWCQFVSPLQLPCSTANRESILHNL